MVLESTLSRINHDEITHERESTGQAGRGVCFVVAKLNHQAKSSSNARGTHSLSLVDCFGGNH